MSPTLEPENIVLISKYFFSKPKIGDIIACLDPRNGKVIIKRITRIKNQELHSCHSREGGNPDSSRYKSKSPENRMYFVTGDNKEESTDSRTFGMIAQKDIIGKLIYVI